MGVVIFIRTPNYVWKWCFSLGSFRLLFNIICLTWKMENGEKQEAEWAWLLDLRSRHIRLRTHSITPAIRWQPNLPVCVPMLERYSHARRRLRRRTKCVYCFWILQFFTANFPPFLMLNHILRGTADRIDATRSDWTIKWTNLCACVRNQLRATEPTTVYSFFYLFFNSSNTHNLGIEQRKLVFDDWDGECIDAKPRKMRLSASQ